MFCAFVSDLQLCYLIKNFKEVQPDITLVFAYFSATEGLVHK